MKYLFVLLSLFYSSDFCSAHVPASVSSFYEKPVFVHAVYFWLRDNVTDAEKAEFKDLLKSLKKIRTVRHLYVGNAAGTQRAVVDNTYDVALIVQFRDKAGHDVYQADEFHKEVITHFEGWIKDIRIYDMISNQ